MAPTKAPEKKNQPTTLPHTTNHNPTAQRNQMLQDDIEALPGAVTGLDSAEKYLTNVLLRQADEPLSLLHLVGILFQVTQMAKPIPLAVTNAIRAVAFILKQQAASEIADVVAKAAAKQLTNSLSTNIVNSVIAAIAPQVASIHTTAESLIGTLAQSKQLHDAIEREKEEEKNDLKTAAERIEDAVDTLYESIEDCNNSYKLLTPSLKFTQDRLNNLATQLSQPPPVITQPTVTPPAFPTYSSVAAANLPPSIDQAVARASLRAKQILLDPTPGHSLFLAEATNATIAKRISDILSEIRGEGTPTGAVRAVQRLRNGGLIVELDNEQLAGWLKGPTGRMLLESQLDSPACIRDRTYSIWPSLDYTVQRVPNRMLRKLQEPKPHQLESQVSGIHPPLQDLGRTIPGEQTPLLPYQLHLEPNHPSLKGTNLDAQSFYFSPHCRAAHTTPRYQHKQATLPFKRVDPLQPTATAPVPPMSSHPPSTPSTTSTPATPSTPSSPTPPSTPVSSPTPSLSTYTTPIASPNSLLPNV
ncbi:uncharacterized protein HD556DRAFT_1306148 [Suillus plorans]|uniref:Uncharacterized protein n=1 Tax=Suillus plorans TaxID=116603 RepID=A0A9P7DLX7_9AGAM|nr:uncharacterized protein HD556DRAFT_1306148 [Suillus plorans]KAG1798097.1 hypothetical protein HD556DRAFT_1306148 [Suillus plorans]